MGLLDILGQIGGRPRGQSPIGGKGGGTGLSPIATALIALLASKSLGGSGSPGGGQPGGPFGNAPAGGAGGGLGNILGSVLGGGQPRGGMPPGGGTGGGIGDLLGGLLGGAGAPGGGTGGNVLSGGLNDLLRQFERGGHGNAAQSWIGRGENQRISPAEIEDALGSDQVDSLAEQAGLSRVGLLEGLSQELPGFVDQLTPDGRIPTDEEADRML